MRQTSHRPVTNAYLTLAKKILVASRRPMSVREIMRVAFTQRMVPTDLFGKTQHKTLHARLAENIRILRERSQFFRTGPGIFFLRELVNDPALPDGFKFSYRAPKRQLPMKETSFLAVHLPEPSEFSWQGFCHPLSFSELKSINPKFMYKNKLNNVGDSALVVVFVVVKQGNKFLTHRIGRYREEKEKFASFRSFGFFSLVSENHRTLFNYENFGLGAACVELIMSDIGLQESNLDIFSMKYENTILENMRFYYSWSGDERPTLLSVVEVDISTLNQYRRRLSITNLEWSDFPTIVRHISRFDPWSRCVISMVNRD